MITNDQELAVTQQRIQQFHGFLLRLRQGETSKNDLVMAHAYLLEIDKMNEEVQSYLAQPPTPHAETIP